MIDWSEDIMKPMSEFRRIGLRGQRKRVAEMAHRKKAEKAGCRVSRKGDQL